VPHRQRREDRHDVGSVLSAASRQAGLLAPACDCVRDVVSSWRRRARAHSRRGEVRQCRKK
jgi:hypothetical protein